LALDECGKQGIVAMHYDSIGVGEGVRGTLQSTEQKGHAGFRYLVFIVGILALISSRGQFRQTAKHHGRI
jgi:hypothetical protein